MIITITIIIIIASCCRAQNARHRGSTAQQKISNRRSSSHLVCHVQNQLWVIQLINYHGKKMIIRKGELFVTEITWCETQHDEQAEIKP